MTQMKAEFPVTELLIIKVFRIILRQPMKMYLSYIKKYVSYAEDITTEEKGISSYRSLLLNVPQKVNFNPIFNIQCFKKSPVFPATN